MNIIGKWDDIYQKYSFMINILVSAGLEIVICIFIGNVTGCIIGFVVAMLLYTILTMYSTLRKP